MEIGGGAGGVQNGRDHNPFGFTMWLAGGGVKGGTVYGATDDFGFKAIDKPVHVHDLHATILHLLGHRSHQADVPLQRPRFPPDRRIGQRDPRDHRVSRTAIVAVAMTAAMSAAADLSYVTPDGWIQKAPSSSMRVAEFTLPRAAGDSEDAQLVIYYFGGGGGGVDANIERWVGQIRQPDGRPSDAVAKRQTRTVNGLKVTLLDVAGTYVSDMTPGNPAHPDKTGYRLRAAVVETPKGPYFLKLVGPARTVTAGEKGFEQLVASLKVAP